MHLDGIQRIKHIVPFKYYHNTQSNPHPHARTYMTLSNFQTCIKIKKSTGVYLNLSQFTWPLLVHPWQRSPQGLTQSTTAKIINIYSEYVKSTNLADSSLLREKTKKQKKRTSQRPKKWRHYIRSWLIYFQYHNLKVGSHTVMNW